MRWWWGDCNVVVRWLCEVLVRWLWYVVVRWRQGVASRCIAEVWCLLLTGESFIFNWAESYEARSSGPCCCTDSKHTSVAATPTANTQELLLHRQQTHKSCYCTDSQHTSVAATLTANTQVLLLHWQPTHKCCCYTDSKHTSVAATLTANTHVLLPHKSAAAYFFVCSVLYLVSSLFRELRRFV